MNREMDKEDMAMEKRNIGEVKIASDVVAVIAGLAANEA